MSHTFGRWTRLAALGAGVATAAAIALSSAGSALADPTDGTGTGTITFNTKFLSHLAKWGIVVIQENPATSSDTSGYDAFTLPVTGGNGSDTNFSGDVNLGGGLTLIDGITGHAVHFTNLQLDYFDGVITGIPEGTTTFLNTTLKSTSTGKKNRKTYTGFTPGTTTSGKHAFTITYAVTIT